MAKKISSSDLFEQEDIFKGIKDSATEAINKLEQMEMSLKGIAQATEPLIKNANFSTTKGIKEFTDATQKAESVSKEFLAVEKEKQTLRRAQAQAEQAEIKTKKERIALEQRETAIANKTAKETANKTSAYKQLEASTRALKNQSKELGAQLLNLTKSGQQNTAEFAKLEQQYKEVTAQAQAGDTELKQLDKTIGDNFRNVGNYEGATKSLKAELRELTQALANMDSSDPQFQQMANRAGELKDKMQDAKSVVQATAGSAVENLGKSFAKMGQVGVAGVQGITAGMQLLGVENEDTLKSIAKLQALAGLADSLSVLGGLGDAMTEIKAGITSAALKMGILTTARVADTTATGAQIIATEAEAVATAEATTAQLAFNTAILTNPYVLAIAGIVALVAGLYSLSKAYGGQSKAQKEAEQNEKNMIKYRKEQSAYIGKESAGFATMISRLQQTNAGSKERSKLITEINGKYGTTLKNLSDEAKFQESLNTELAVYMEYQRQKFNIQKNEELIGRNLEKQSDAKGKLSKAEKQYASVLKQQQYVYKDMYETTDEGKRVFIGREKVLNTTRDAELKRLGIVIATQKDILKKAEERFKNYGMNAQEATDKINELTNQGTKYGEVTDNNTSSNQDNSDSVDKVTLSNQELIDKVKELKEELHDLQSSEEQRLANQLVHDREALQATYDASKKDLEAKQKLDAGLILLEEKYWEDIAQLEADADKKQLDEMAERDKKAKDQQDAINKQLEEDRKEAHDKEIELEKQKQKEIQDVVKATSEFFTKQTEKRIDEIDKESNKAKEQYEFLKGLAESGNIDAQQSLAEQQKIIDEANLRKERELKKQQRIKLAESVYATYSQKIESGSENALAETIRDTTLLSQFISSLPAFDTGTEDTGANGRGVDGKGGFHAILHPNERVIPKSLNDQIGTMSNEDLTRIAQEYQNNRNFGNYQSGTSLELALLVNEIKDLKTIIKDKPETNIELGQITTGAMEIVKSIKQGNTTTYNRYKVK